MSSQCIFCRIIRGEMKGEIVFQDDRVAVLRDINPQAPTHLLVMPKEHISSLLDLGPQHKDLMGHLILVATDMARQEGIAERGFRLSVNTGPEGGQYVPHIHFHLVGGRRLEGALG